MRTFLSSIAIAPSRFLHYFQTPLLATYITFCPKMMETFYITMQCIYSFLIIVVVSSNVELDGETILLNFFDSTNGLKWKNRTNWLDSTSNVCAWFGIECVYNEKNEGIINSISLENNKLSGHTTRELFHLVDITTINLRGNRELEFVFDGVEHATSLKEIILSETRLKSLDGIEMARSLETLHVTNSGMSGSIPSGIFALENLKQFYGNYNLFTGSVPSKIDNLVHLEELFLFGNELSGTLPDTIGSLSMLRILALSDNNFSGSLPKSINNLIRLEVLALELEDDVAGTEKNREKRGISGPLPELSNLAEISEIYLARNRLTGTIPSSFLNAVKDTSDTIFIDLSFNHLSGTIPSTLSKFDRLQIFLAENKIQDIPKEFCSKENWMTGDVSTFDCDAILCPPNTFNVDGRQSSSETPCQTCPKTSVSKFYGSMSCTPFSHDASLPLARYTDFEVLELFFQAMDGRFWKRNDNWLDKTIPICKWYGVVCDGKSLVESIILESNGLSGSFPHDVIYQLSSLQTLNLSANSISFSFQGIENAYNLQKLLLSSSGLESLVGIANSPSTLTTLDVQNNHLTDIPDELFGITSLVELFISNNKLNENMRLSPKIGTLINLQTFECYSSNLSGQLPMTIGLLSKLTKLDLSENRFSGTLPSELNLLTQLTYLSLHQNANARIRSGISGPLLDFANLTYLNELYLDFNDLSGTIPTSFLQNLIQSEHRVTIDISSNSLTGAIPLSLQNFENLNIDLADNRITDIDKSFCKQNGWMSGNVATFGCDAILCPKGATSVFGKSSPTDKCTPCDEHGLAPYFGMTKCLFDTSSEVNADSQDWSMIEILEKFFFATNGRNWVNNTNWLDPFVDVCNWFGITCYAYESNGEQRIQKVKLQNNGLSGTPPTEIYQLSYLQELDLKGNHLSSFSFEGIEQATSLINLILSNTGLASISGVGKATSLEILHLTDNVLDGNLEDEVFDLVNLKGLYLNYNKLTGRLSHKIAMLVQLEELFIFHNTFSGQIPASIGSISNLQILAMGSNFFSGTLPEEMNDLVNLQILSLDGNKKYGGGITGPLISFPNSPFVQELDLENNKLSGSIPSDFLSAIINTNENLQVTVNLISNKLTAIPPSLASLHKLNFYITQNEIEEVADILCSKNGWMDGAVYNFRCDAIACPPNSYNEYGRQIDTLSPCIPCMQSAWSPFYGSIECSSGSDLLVQNEKKLLEDFYHHTGGDQWKNNDKWLKNEDICTWYGVTCVSYNTPSIKSLSLSSNSLSGTIPSFIFDLSSLTEIDLSDNDAIVAFNFERIKNAKNLAYLNLDATALTSLAGLDKATSIKFFSCSQCGLSSTVPEWFGSFLKLQHLSLDNNHFSGTIPLSLNSLKHLRHIDLSNQISGVDKNAGITGQLINLSEAKSMKKIYLQNNKLTGSIPRNFLKKSDIDTLLVVDLRENMLTGKVPGKLLRFVNLSLYLAWNKITEVPNELCDSPTASSWMNGDVRNLGCDGFMCPPGTFNADGRQTDSGLPCTTCEHYDENSVLEYFGSMECEQIKQTETSSQRKILQLFFTETGGENWDINTNWLSSSSVCDWYGVTCHVESGMEDQIQSIDLSYNRVHNIPPSEMFQLPYLEELNLKGNPISFKFIGIEKAKNLKSLILSETGLKSVDGIGNATGLTHLHLTDNSLVGLIPDEIFELCLLKELFLNYNHLSGTIPPKISNLKTLEGLYLFNNELSGQIPAEIGFLQHLKVLTLANNFFSGSLPYELNFLQNLEILAIQRESTNKNDGKILAGIHGPLLNFSTATNLQELYLGSNQLTGTIPSTFLGGLSDKSKSVKVDLTLNMLIGNIPSELASIRRLDLFLAGNKIDGIADELCSAKEWMNGEVGTFGCNAILCPPNTFNFYGRQIPDNICKSCNSSSDSIFSGNVNCEEDKEMLTEKRILEMIYNKTSGFSWKDNNNWMDSKTSICLWYGVKCLNKENSDGKVIALQLSSNGLTGTLPNVVFKLPYLKVLDIHDNMIDFNFNGMSSAIQLDHLNLDATKISNLDGIGNTPPRISVLSLQGNNFNGMSIPVELFSLVGLRKLSLSYSNFSGNLPSAIGNLKSLEEFYCAGNHLSGEIPASIGLLSKIELIILNENTLSGQLPIGLTRLPKLHTLSIDSFTNEGGGLTGTLPNFSNLPVLSKISLGANELTGSIPPSLLKGIKDPMQEIVINLQLNSFQGTIPSELSRFKRLHIDLTGNKIESIAPILCDKKYWMSGAVELFGCEAILCQPGMYNVHGRMSNEEEICQKCTTYELPFYGSVECGSSARKKELEVLENIYYKCNGINWKHQSNWLDESIDYCNWYGISCDDNSLVESITLGSNNLRGTIPSEIFELKELSQLWLYSNPIDVVFIGIKTVSTSKISSLLLDSTNITSLQGIENLSSLTELDLRFNSLKGRINDIDGIFELVNLESLSLSDNILSGHIPYAINQLKNLKKLRLSNNYIHGLLPSFEEHPNLRSIDLSNNKISGTIKPTFLQSLNNVTDELFIDVSFNSITGNLPSALSRFRKLNLNIENNRITNIDAKLCEKENWNNGDVGKYQCDGIACTIGYYNEFGRQTDDDSPCLPCNTSTFLGCSSCNSIENTPELSTKTTVQRKFALFVLGTFVLIGNIAICVNVFFGSQARFTYDIVENDMYEV